jgi:branched-chain amino acid transport system substrate-binding protein
MRHVAITLALTATLSLSACDNPARHKAEHRPHRPGTFDCANGAITLGFVKAESGPFAFFDTAGENGARVALAAIQKQGGILGCRIKVIGGNTQSDPALARQVAEDVIREGADIVVTPGDFDVGVGASQAAQEAGLLSVSFEASASAWSRAIKPWHFTTAITETDQGKAISALAAQRGWNSAWIVTNDAYNVFTATEKAFRESYEGQITGRDIVADDAADYSASVSKIRAAQGRIGFIFLNDYFPHVGTFIRQLRAAGITLPVVGNQNFSTPALPATVGPIGLRNVFYVAQGFYEGPRASPQARAFTQGYTQRFGSFPPNANALAGYEGMLILANALRRAGTTDPAPLAGALSSERDVPGTTSTIYRWTERHPERAAAVIGFDEQGRFTDLGVLDPGKTRGGR